MAYKTPNITNALGKPVVEQKQDYFCIFEGAFSTTPEIIDQTSYKITYVVDGQGNISKPAEAQPSSYNILQNFENDKNVTVILDQATTENSALAGVKSITAIGQPVPYLFSSNGLTSESYETRLVFRPPGAPPSGSYNPMAEYTYQINSTQAINSANGLSTSNNFGLALAKQGVLAGVGGFNFTYTAAKSPDPTVAHISSSGMYQIDNIADDFVSLNWVNSVQIDIENMDSTNTYYANDELEFQFGIQVGDWESDDWSTFIMTQVQPVPNISPFNNGVSVDSSGVISIPANTSQYSFTERTFQLEKTLTREDIVNAPSGAGGRKYIRMIMAQNKTVIPIDISSVNPTIQFPFINLANQSPLAANYFAALNPDGQENTPFYWNTSSIEGGGTIPNKWLTGSRKLSEFYGDYYVSTGAQNQFGYADPNITFTPQPGDKIRFQYNPNNLYNIYAVKTPAENGGNLALLLDGLPETGSLQNFILYRVDNSLAADMILNVKKTITIGDPENPFTGIILPQYPSDNILNNVDKILEKLKADGIIRN